MFCIPAILCRSKTFLHREAHQSKCAKQTIIQLLFSNLFSSAVCSCSSSYYKGSRQSISVMSDLCTDLARHNIQILKNLGIEAEDKTMDVIVAGKPKDAKQHIIFFGGDVQDYPEEMQSHRDNGKYIRWNSLATAGRLCERFPGAMVFVVKPHQMHLKTFSVYSQFVQSNDFGVPTHSPDYGAWKTLIRVYIQAVRIALSDSLGSGTECIGEDVGKEGSQVDYCALSSLSETPVHLIGFSKGCVVLNQLVHELTSVEGDKETQDFFSRVSAITWLDGGHSGGSNTWVTDQSVLQQLADHKVDIYIHVSPYQVKDEMRRWIGKEKRRFVEILRKAHAKVTDTLHFEDEPKSIENHFRILEVF